MPVSRLLPWTSLTHPAAYLGRAVLRRGQEEKSDTEKKKKREDQIADVARQLDFLQILHKCFLLLHHRPPRERDTMQELGSFEVPATRPHVSMKTVPMAGLLVDVYGLDELPDDSTMTLTCLWLLHPRTRDRSQMGDVACRVVDAWKQRQQNGGYHKGLVALAFDMPNHGSRLVSQDANKAWNKGNENHAPDMAGMIRGGSADMSGLMDLVGAYLGREIHGHICLGWSLGGHAAWQAWLGEERLDAAVVIVGCPDFLGA